MMKLYKVKRCDGGEVEKLYRDLENIYKVAETIIYGGKNLSKEENKKCLREITEIVKKMNLVRDKFNLTRLNNLSY